MKHAEDTYLLMALSKGEKSAFDVIFRKYYPVLCAYAKRLVGMEDAEELVEETMIWLWEHRESHTIESSLGNYLIKSVYHRMLNQKKRNELQIMADTRFFNEMQEWVLETDFCQVQELSKHIRKAIEELPDSYREVFIMHRFQEKSYKEIAEQLGVSTKTVDYRMQQALRLLRKELQKYLLIVLWAMTNQPESWIR